MLSVFLTLWASRPPTLFSTSTFLLLVLAISLPFTNAAASTISGELAPLMKKRIETILSSSSLQPSSLQKWVNTLGSNGKWPDNEIDYASGCNAQRANWPAVEHLKRIDTMAAAYHGPLRGAEKFRNDPKLLEAISSAVDWWFQRDFTINACLDEGGTGSCPCSTPGLWNTNWYSNTLLVPSTILPDCLLLSDSLSSSQLATCTRIGVRAYNAFNSKKGYVSGANILGLASIGVDVGLLANNESIVTEAYQRLHAEMTVQGDVGNDGIHADGSFGQHRGLLYNGNYGKDFINSVMALEAIAAGTKFAAGSGAKNAFATLLDGSRWTIVMNSATKVAHWDLSVISRFITFPIADSSQAAAGLNMNLTRLKYLADTWNSDTLKNVHSQLTKSASNANIGPLNGMKNFFRNDYFVRRGKNYVTTIKGYSSRTLNSECTNNQNPFGFHLADGLTYQYITGGEYEDVAAAWDWDLLPGITVNYKGTPLSCDSSQRRGVESFVGGASSGDVGVFAMRYTNPQVTSFGWRKSTFFFKNDTQHVVISHIKTSDSTPIGSVLDQRRRSGDPQVDFKTVGSGNYSTFSSLWHGNIGYYFGNETSVSTRLTISTGTRTGKWSDIGTSKQPASSVNMFAAWLYHTDPAAPISYTVFPGTTLQEFKSKQPNRLQTLSRGDVHATFDSGAMDLAAVYWAANTEVEISNICSRRLVVNSDKPIVVLLSRNFKMTISDPSQKLSQVTIKVSLLSGSNLSGWGTEKVKSFTVSLPGGNMAGSVVTVAVSSTSC